MRMRSGSESSLINGELESNVSSVVNSSRLSIHGNAASGGTDDKLISAQRVIRKLYRKSIEVASNLTQIVCLSSVVFSDVVFVQFLKRCLSLSLFINRRTQRQLITESMQAGAQLPPSLISVRLSIDSRIF